MHSCNYIAFTGLKAYCNNGTHVLCFMLQANSQFVIVKLSVKTSPTVIFKTNTITVLQDDTGETHRFSRCEMGVTGVATTPTAALAEVSKLKLVTHGPIEMESVWPMLSHFHLGQLVYSKALSITPQHSH